MSDEEQPVIESGLLAGQTDPAMREILKGISRGLRERYGTIESPRPVQGAVVSGEQEAEHVERLQQLLEQQQFRRQGRAVAAVGVPARDAGPGHERDGYLRDAGT